MLLVDVHAHLDHSRFKGELDDVIDILLTYADDIQHKDQCDDCPCASEEASKDILDGINKSYEEVKDNMGRTREEIDETVIRVG